MPGSRKSLLRRWGVLGYTALFFALGGLVPVANGQPTPDPVPGTTAGPTPDPAPLGRPRVVTQSRPVVVHTAPAIRTSIPSVVPRTAARAARGARAAPRATRARTPAKPKVVVRSVPRDAPVVLRSAAALVLDQPARVTTTFAVLALFAVILASGSFLGVLVEVRRNLR
jgi:hypothetical protein